jgi:exodeoxyribonuclease VII large subunit
VSPLPPNPDGAGQVWSLSRLAREFTVRLEEEWPALWVRGEISGLKLHASSGHRYFTLKDAQAQFSAVMWRSRAEGAVVAPSDGLQVEALVRLVFYAPRGQLQLDVQRLRAAGRGDLMQAFLDLRERLAREGLFDTGRKRPLPPFPRRIGLLTAEGGAALQDLLKVLRRRQPGLRCFLLPVPVQGPACGPVLARGLVRLSSWPDLRLDLIIVGRGGGSFEDLFGFNDEGLVRAIAACPVPVISAVGHEIDTTLSDLAADLRAPTPSAAAEMAVPDAGELERRLESLAGRLRAACAGRLRNQALRLAALHTHRALAEPQRRLLQARQRVDELGERLPGALARLQAEAAGRLLGWPRRLATLAGRAIRQAEGGLEQRRRDLAREMQRGLEVRRGRLDGLAARLERLEAGRLKAWALRLGFALVWDEQGRLVRGLTGRKAGDILLLEFHDGHAVAELRQIGEESP